MSRLYDAAEPGVIDESLLHSLIIEQGPEGEVGKIIEKEGIEFDEVFELRIDFKNVQQIENLWQLKNLVKLRLDNNIISSISGLEQLVNLEWLDLSFNNIKDIQGLDHLKKLKDLSLAHNFIKEVGGLKTLERLQVLSIGYNELHDLQGTALYLRGLPLLQSLCLRGNKFSPVPSSHTTPDVEDTEAYRHYQLYCIALIPSLVYLDYRIILEEIRAIAEEQHFELLQEIDIKEKEDRQKSEIVKENQKKLDHFLASYIDGLEGEQLYHALFEEDTESERLSLLPGEMERLDEYRKQVVNICQEIVQIGLEEERKRRNERDSFYSAHRSALETNQGQSVARVQQYEEEKAMLIGEHQINLLGEKITELHYDLMKFEMQLVDQVDDIAKEFERNYTELINHFFEAVQARTTQLRDLEKNHYETVLEMSTQLLESYTKGQLEEDLPEGLKILFVDKDTLLGAINSAHDTHMMVIDNKEDSIRSRAETDKNKLLSSIVQKEYTRNRQRVTEITQYIDLQHEELEDWLSGTKE